MLLVGNWGIMCQRDGGLCSLVPLPWKMPPQCLGP